MRWVFLLLPVAACGRIGFDERVSAVDGLVLPDTLVAYYPLELLAPEGPSAIVPEATGRHDGSCALASDRCPVVVPGRIGNAFRFDGVDDLVIVASDPTLESRAGFTVAAWLGIEGAPPTRACAATKGFRMTTQNSWAVCIEPSRQVFFFTSTAAASDGLLSSNPVQIGTYHHVAIRWDGAVKTILLDGVQVAMRAALTEFDTDSIRIGGELDDNLPIALFPGAIDDLRIYRVALTDDEVRALAQP